MIWRFDKLRKVAKNGVELERTIIVSFLLYTNLLFQRIKFNLEFFDGFHKQTRQVAVCEGVKCFLCRSIVHFKDRFGKNLHYFLRHAPCMIFLCIGIFYARANER